MKRLLLFIVIIGLFHWGQAQVKSPVMTGNATGQKVQVDNSSFTFNVGSAIPYFYKGSSKTYLQVGFPYNVLYAGEIFDGTLLVSKGYFGNQVVLKWGIKNNAEDITGFKIYRRKLGDNFIEIEKDYNKAERSYTDKTELDANTVYEYKVYAVGVYPMEIPGINSISGFGFRQPTASIAGNITYAGGTGVRDVKVLAETSEMPAMYSALFNGATSYIDCTPGKEILINEGFTFQAYLQPVLPTGDEKMTIFDCEEFHIYIQNIEVKCEDKAGNIIVNTDFSSIKNGDEYFHFSLVLSKEKSTIYLNNLNKQSVAQGKGFDTEKLKIFSIGNRKTDIGNTEFYKGNIDEVRIWNQPLDPTDIKRDYSRYINGNENGLIAYYRLNEDITAGAEKFVVDYSKIGLKFNENHAYFTDGELNNTIPTTEKLWFKGITDETGYYAITGIPVTSAGASYTITPMFDNHEFQPGFKKLYIDENATVHNNVDFTDKSSFSATLSVLFEGTSIGVEGVEVYIDDNALFNKDTKDYIKTNANGDVTISVPIGFHTVKLKKQGHIFQDSTWTKNFIQNEVSPKRFNDLTKVMVAGRIVGGTQEGNKPLGFNLSTNNLKNPVIKLKRYTDGTTPLYFGIPDGESINDINYSTDLNSTTSFTNSEIIITPDPSSGEFVAFVFPIKYEIEAISDESQPFTYFGGSPKLEYDLSVIPKEKLKSELKDETGKVIKSKEYQFEKKLIYRVNPSLAVTRSNDHNIGELEFKYKDKDGIAQILNLTTNFKYPIFQFGTKYTLKFKAEEVYNGYENGNAKEFEYPVEQGKIVIDNQCRINYNSGEAETIDIKEENEGEFYYSFKAGVPNLSKDPAKEEDSFTKTITAVLKTGDDYKKETYWPGPGNNDVQRCYVIGEYPIESNDFITVNASVPFLILRDPPGKNSYAFVEKGSSHTYKSSMKLNTSEEYGLDTEVKLGLDLKVGGGILGPLIETITVNSSGTNLKSSTSFTDEGEYITTVEFNERIQTSSDPTNVGAMADIYVGKALNLVFTPSKNLRILPKAETDIYITDDNKLTSNKDGDFTLGIKDGTTASEDLSKETYFYYTQAHIINELIPGLESQRNLLLKNSTAKYILADGIDIESWKFGLANEHIAIKDDPSDKDKITKYEAWFNPANLTDSIAIKAIEALGENTKWLAYTFIPGIKENTLDDKVMNFNRDIGKWIGMIQLNEQEKVLALESLKNKGSEKITNISFDGGVGEISKSFKKIFNQSDTYTRTFNNNIDFNGKLGFTVSGFGVETTAKMQFNTESVVGTSSSDEQAVTFGYVISDGDAGDYYSVDVFERINEGNYKLDSIKKYHPTMKDISVLGGFTALMDNNGRHEAMYASMATKIAANSTNAVTGGIGIIASVTAYAVTAAAMTISYWTYFNALEKAQDSLPGTKDWDISGFELSSPIFSVVGGSTMCPWQGSEYSNFYFNPDTKKPYQLHHATQQREKPKISCNPSTINNVPATSKAYFTMMLENESESQDDQWYTLSVLEKSNPKGAVVLMDGTPLNNRTILVPHGKKVEKIVTVHPSNPAVIEFDTIKIVLQSQCEPEIASIARISAQFVASCSPVNISSPNTNWVINENGNKMIPLKIDGFDINYTGFKYLVLQSKSSHSGTWGNRVAFAVNDGDIQTIKTEKSIQDVRSISELQNSTFNLSFDGLGNGPKDIRVISVCSDGTENSSNIISGMFDDRPPRVFGNPQPADGILSAGDDLSIEFNEPIDQNYLYSFNKSWFFQIRGTTSYDSLRHVSYVKFEDKDDKMVIPNTLSLANKPFTIEFWLKRNNQNHCVLLSQGGVLNELKIEFNNDKTIFSFGSEKFEADLLQSTSIPWNDWNHFAYTYDYNNGAVEIYQNDNIILQKQLNLLQVLNIPASPIIIGNNGNAGFSGFMHELRIWNKYLLHGDVYSKQSISLTGNEYGLYGYWPMNEADGSIIRDYAANRHIESTAGWEVHPIGFSGGFVNNKYLTLNTSDVVIEPEMDYTIEFWFKREPSIAEVTLFSNQTGEEQSDSLKQKTMSIRGVNNELRIYSNMNDKFLIVPAINCFNNQWHHFALIVKRMGGVKALFDGEVVVDNSMVELGGLAGSKMTLGALFADEEFKTPISNYFGGYIDEFRIWDLARKINQINLYKNTKLHGDEFGLKFYLPFEDYMADEINPNYFKKSLINYTKDAVGSLQSSDLNLCSDISPSIKDVKSVVDINFDFVPSENKIVFNTPEALLHELEKNLIEITVKNVSDLYGNILSSAETWTAYVSRNQVRWEDERRTFTKEIYKPMEFVSTIKNTGGQQIGFTIANLPAWLTASPSSGVLNPESTLEIKFTINPAINIGDYNLDIILHTDNGFDEKLPLTVRVYKTPPNWKVNPSEFEESMSIVGSVKIEEVLSTDIFDMVAAFKRGTDLIRGVSNVRYVKEFDSYLVFLSVYGNVVGEELEFRIWDAGAGQIIDDVKVTYNYIDKVTNLEEEKELKVFDKDKVYGTTLDPAIFDAKESFRQYIPLAKGWNWVSFNKKSSKQDVLNSFLSSLELRENDQIKLHTEAKFASYTSNNDWSDNFKIDNLKMYQIKISKADTIVYSGSYIEPEKEEIILVEKWNHIGYLPDLAMDVNDAMRLYVADTSEVIKSQFAFSMYDHRVGWVGTLEMMQPGLGYMLKVNKKNAGAVLKYPNTTVFKSSKIPFQTSPPLSWNSNFSNYEGNISVVARLDLSAFTELNIKNDLVLGGFINKECRGFISPLRNSGFGYEPFFLTISNSENGQMVGFRLYDGATGNTYSIEETVPFVTDRVYGTTNEPLVLTLKSLLTGEGGFDNTSFIRCYPNPFNEQVNVEFSGINGDVIIDVVNATGSQVKNIFKGYPVNGINTLVWNGTNQEGKNVSAGIYYVRFISGETVNTVKISKTR